jgi:hypothetical protein
MKILSKITKVALNMQCSVGLSNGRSWSNDRLRFIAKSLPNFKNALNISGNFDSDKQGEVYQNYFKAEKYIISSYVGDKTYSNPSKLFELDLDDDISKVASEHSKNYDLVFNHTVLEHVKNPFQAFANLENLLAPNGILISVVPFIYKFHYSNGDFGDYWRFTPHTIDLLHKQSNLYVKLLEVGPSKGYEKYLISVATKGHEIPNFKFDTSSFSEWNNNLGDNSLPLLTKNLIQKVFDSIKLRTIYRKTS